MPVKVIGWSVPGFPPNLTVTYVINVRDMIAKNVVPGIVQLWLDVP